MTMAFGQGQYETFGGVGASPNMYPNPFLDLAAFSLPSQHKTALWWCEHIYMLFGAYRSAMEKVIAYFLTEIEFQSTESEDVRDKWRDRLNDMRVLEAAQELLHDKACYGNAFASVHTPFIRFLGCPKCKSGSIRLSEIADNSIFKFEFNLPDFIATCPSCKVGSGYRGPFVIRDRAGSDEKVRIKKWSPHEIELVHDHMTDECKYIWRIPEDYKRVIRQGHLWHLERCPKSVLEAIANGSHYEFNPDVIYHMKEPTLGGIINRGWGLPRIVSHFRQICTVQVYRKYNEQIALEYVMPWRVITPAPRPGSSGGGGMAGLQVSDPMAMMNGGTIRSMIMSMVAAHRRDPLSVQVLPFPINMQVFGGDAAKLAPVELLDQAVKQLLSDVGTPIELFDGTLQFQAAPVALRLFESVWRHVVQDTNRFLRWLTDQLSEIFSWESIEATMKRVTVADNFEQQMMATQLMLGQKMSGTTVFRDLGRDWRQEQRNMAEEAKFQAELAAKTEEEAQKSGLGKQMAQGGAQGGAPPGGAPPGGAPQGGAPAGGDPSQQQQPPISQYLTSFNPNQPRSPVDVMNTADALAQALIGLPESIKDSELRRLKNADPTLHPLVIQRLAEYRKSSQQGAQMPAM